MTIVVLDTGVLGLACHPSRRELFMAVWEWMEALRDAGHIVAVPEVADYELRRELLRINRLEAVAILNRFGDDFRYLPLSSSIMRSTAELWAKSRQRGRVTAHDHAFDGDVILAAQTLALEKQGERCIVATTNVRHLNWFVDARTWDSIDQVALS
jgi:predicted nucleic acid-binding protein